MYSYFISYTVKHMNDFNGKISTIYNNRIVSYDEKVNETNCAQFINKFTHEIECELGFEFYNVVIIFYKELGE